MSYRTFHTYGTVHGHTALIVSVNDQVVKKGELQELQCGLLFEFSTHVSLHGSVVVCIEIIHGSITISHSRVTYPAEVQGQLKLVNMPQPIHQSVFPLHVNASVTYNHYMFNGPNRFVVNSEQLVDCVLVIHDFLQAIEHGIIKEKYDYDAVKVVDLDIGTLHD